MKKILFLISILLVFIFVACSKEKEENILEIQEECQAMEITTDELAEIEILDPDIFIIRKENLIALAKKEGFKKGEKVLKIDSKYTIRDTIKKSSTDIVGNGNIYIEKIPVLENKNEEFEIKIHAVKMFDIDSMNLEIICDKKGEFISAEISSGKIGENYILNVEEQKVNFAFTSSKVQMLDETLFTVKFRISSEEKENVKEKEYTNFFKVQEIKYEQYNKISNLSSFYFNFILKQQGDIKPLGDYNNDGNVDIIDFSFLKINYASSDKNIIEDYDIAKNTSPVAGNGTEGSLEGVYIYPETDGKIGLGELIVVVNNLQTWQLLDLENETYVEIDRSKMVINKGENFTFKIAVKKLVDGAARTISDIEKITVKKVYNGIELGEAELSNLSSDMTYTPDVIGDYTITVYPKVGAKKSFTFEVVNFVDSQIRLKAVQGENIVYDIENPTALEVIATGDAEQGVYFQTQVNNGTDFENVDASLKYTIEGDERIYNLSNPLFTTKMAGIYHIWAEYNDGVKITKTKEIVVNVKQGVKYVRIYSDAVELEPGENTNIHIEIINMENKNIISDINIAKEVLKDIVLVIKDEMKITDIRFEDIAEQISIDLDRKTFVYNYIPNVAGSVKVTAKYVYKNGLEVFSENTANPNGGIVNIYIGKVAKSMVFSVARVELINSSYAAIQTTRAISYNTEEYPTMAKKRYSSAEVKYYNVSDINFSSKTADKLLKAGAVEIATTSTAIIEAKNNTNLLLLSEQDMVNDTIEHPTINTLANNSDKIYFGVDFYTDIPENIAIYSENTGIYTINDNAQKINEDINYSEIKLYYYDNGNYKQEDIDESLVFSKVTSGGYRDYYVKYGDLSSHFVRVNVVEPAVSMIGMKATNEIKYQRVNETIAFLNTSYLEISFDFKDQMGNTITADTTDFSLYIVNATNPTTTPGSIQYLKNYSEGSIMTTSSAIAAGEYLNPLSIPDSDSNGKIKISDSNYYRGNLKINLNNNFVLNNAVRFSDFYIVVQSKNKNTEDIIYIKFIDITN